MNIDTKVERIFQNIYGRYPDDDMDEKEIERIIKTIEGDEKTTNDKKEWQIKVERLKVEIEHTEDQIQDAEMYLQDLKEQKTEQEEELIALIKTKGDGE